jgi:hypothetical protein
MRDVVDEMVLSSRTSGRFAEPAAAEFADLYAAIGETLKHFDAQIRAAEQELEILHILHSIRAADNNGAQGEALNDNQCWAQRG